MRTTWLLCSQSSSDCSLYERLDGQLLVLSLSLSFSPSLSPLSLSPPFSFLSLLPPTLLGYFLSFFLSLCLSLSLNNVSLFLLYPSSLCWTINQIVLTQTCLPVYPSRFWYPNRPWLANLSEFSHLSSLIYQFICLSKDTDCCHQFTSFDSQVWQMKPKYALR